MLRMLKKGLCGLWYYTLGNILAFMFYDKSFLQGKWFEGKLNGLCAQGWVWVTKDAISRILLGENKEAKFPVSFRCSVICPENIIFDPNDLNNFQSFGIYYQAIGKIEIGKGTYIAPNVGLITTNHDIKDPDKHDVPKSITLGKKCWIGMNAIILGGVTLGDGTVVGAGSVVTKSFPEGHCVLAGNPALKIKNIV